MKKNITATLVIFSLIFSITVFAQTTIQGSFISGGISRDYRIYIPAIYNSSVPVPLVFNLHGYGSVNTAQEGYGDFRPIADTANFIVVHPNGTFNGTGQRFWNTFGASSVDDVGFIAALIDTIKTSYNIDENRIYSTGMSNGGFMSYQLACSLSGRITAIASVTGTMIWPFMNSCNAVHPTPVMQIHGTADGTVPYNGSTSFVPVDTLVNYWAEYNDCSLTPAITNVPNANTTDSCTAERQVFNGGTLGSTVELYKVQDGGHSWPGAPVNINVTNMDFSASTEIWRFFRKYKLNELTNEIRNVSTAPFFSVYPNPCADVINIHAISDVIAKNIRVYDILGNEIFLNNLSNENNTIRISTAGWSRGVYLLSIVEGDARYHQRLIKM